MELSEAVRRRRMVRRYHPDRAVPRDMVVRMLDLATQAPSAGFSQGWHFLVLDTASALARFWAATVLDRPEDAWLSGMRTAPVLILPMSDQAAYLRRYARPDKAGSTSATPAASGGSGASETAAPWPVPYWDLDTAMASVIALLAATDAGLGSCFFGIPAVSLDRLRLEFAIPSGINPIGVIAVGYEAGYLSGRAARARRPISEVASWGDFGQPRSD